MKKLRLRMVKRLAQGFQPEKSITKGYPGGRHTDLRSAERTWNGYR